MIGTTYTLADLARDLRTLGFGRAATAEQAAAGAAALARLLANPTCLAPFGALPAADHNWLLHAEPDDGFTIAALVKAPHQGTPVHDHGATWTLYGVFAGAETIARYERLDDGGTPGRADLRPSTEFLGQPGAVDVVRPWEPHAEVNGAGQSTAIIVRSQPMGSFPQHVFDLEAGTASLVTGATRAVPVR